MISDCVLLCCRDEREEVCSSGPAFREALEDGSIIAVEDTSVNIPTYLCRDFRVFERVLEQSDWPAGTSRAA